MINAPSKQLQRTRYTFVKEAWIRLRGCYHDAKDLLPSAIICAHCEDEEVKNFTVLESPPPREEHPGSAGTFTRRKLSSGGGSVGWRDISPRPDQSRRHVLCEVGASPGLSVGGYLGEFSDLSQW